MRFARTALFLMLPASVLAGCSEQKPQASAPPPPEVIVASPVKKNIVDKDEYVGRFVAIDAVEVRARVSGYLEKVHFTDGQTVKQGDPLFTIDKRPFQNTLDQARAVLAQARANQSFTEGDLQRAIHWCVTAPSPSRYSSSARRRSATPMRPWPRTRLRFGRRNSIWSTQRCARR